MFDLLAKTRVFNGLAAREVEKAMEGIHFQLRSYHNDDIIAYAGEAYDHLLLLIEGSVRGEISKFDGQQVVVSEIHAPGSFAEAFLYASKNKLKINVKATSEVRLLSIGKEYLNRLMHKDIRILENYLNIISNRFVIVTEKLNFMMIKTVKGRLAYYMLNRQEVLNGAEQFPLGRTHQELAVFLGITRPALTRNLLEMKEEGIIDIDRKRVTIRNRDMLNRLVQ